LGKNFFCKKSRFNADFYDFTPYRFSESSSFEKAGIYQALLNVRW